MRDLKHHEIEIFLKMSGLSKMGKQHNCSKRSTARFFGMVKRQ